MYSDALDLYYRRKVAEWDYNTDIAKAREKGVGIGIGIGRQIGKEEGVRIGRNMIILNFFRLGIPVEKIAAGVKLPLSEVLSIISLGSGQ